VVLLLAGAAYYLLTRVLISCHGQDSTLARATGQQVKERMSVLGYLLAVGLAFVNPWISAAIYVAIAVSWLVPDRRIEKAMDESLKSA
jgi:uncharacterized membrane protein